MIINIENEGKKYENEESVNSLIKKIQENKNEIIEINLKGNVFRPEALLPLFQEIQHIKHLRSINLSRIFSALPNSIMIEGLNIICKYLNPHKLLFLDLSDNALSCEFTETFFSFLTKLTSLNILKINNCGLGTIGGNRLSEALEKISNKNNLVSIDVSKNRLVSSATSLGRSFEKFSNLEEIYIQYNNVDKESMDTFLKNFKKHSLRILDIRDNFLSLLGCKILGEYYASCQITHMRMGDCLMGEEGLIEFIKAASSKKEIVYAQGGFDTEPEKVYLDFSYNEIGEEGLHHLTQFVKNKNIAILWIEGNDFASCKELQAVIKKNGGVVIWDEDEEKIEAAVEDMLVDRFNKVL